MKLSYVLCLGKVVYRMSEPPLKKKRTLLDFFRKKTKSNNDEPVKDKKVEIIDVEMTESKPGKSSKPAVNPVEKVFNDISTFGASFDGKGAQAARTFTKTFTEKTDKILKSSFGDTFKYDETMEYNMDSDVADSQGSQDGDSVKPDIPTKKPSQRKANSDWKGKPLNRLNKIPDCMEKLPALHSTENHTVLIKVPYKYDPKTPPMPHPAQYKDGWNNDHVKMPCSPQNEYPFQGKNNKQILRKRWEIIEEALLSKIPGPYELEDIILKYNSRYFGKWNFETLKCLFTEDLTQSERNHFFGEVLPKIAKLALNLPHLCTQPIPLLKKGKTRSITLSQQQIACLLANAFFCTYPRRNAKGKSSEFFNYPSINFNSLYDGMPNCVKLEKLKCIIQYFSRVTKNMPTGLVTFTRQHVGLIDFPKWDNLDTTLRDLHVSAEGTIEDDGEGLLQVDFANKYLGGGVLTHGCVQEEIRFLICPEMIISRLFTEGLEKNESFVMKGCERFSSYDGYARTFEWKGDYDDSKTPRDDWGRLCTHVTAIDALVIHHYDRQFKGDIVKRELNKAYCGFVSLRGTKNPPHEINLSAVCTGNWGCGAFGGDKRLKALIQLMAATAAKRDVCYYTFDDERLKNDIYNIHQYLTVTNPLGIDTILSLIERYEGVLRKSRRKPNMNLFEYIVKVFDGSLENTDSEPDSPAIEKEMSQEMLYRKESCMGDEVVSNNSVKRQLSEDYKANTP
ncbi:PARG [Mytilus coruscus]|uniref:poly(ADP-ribose) glycohydrolase n=1 Tax=Mytilus coruscus TaxID=42192 RepID=A0A6J8AGD6_MYTCO|nr:PARG [Mytilus coruscus]